jgi:hypothetical protein
LERLARLDTTGLDLAAQREAARRRLVEAAPEATRTLLYRVSILIGAFKRSLALTLAEAPSPLAAAGEHLDALTGPWLDRIPGERLRISPLLSDVGTQVLTSAESARFMYGLRSTSSAALGWRLKTRAADSCTASSAAPKSR